MTCPGRMRGMRGRGWGFLVLGFVVIVAVWVAGAGRALAAPPAVPTVELRIGAAEKPQQVATSLQILALLTVLSLAPAVLVMMTCFTRVVVVLGFARNALATQQIPPNQVLIGLALFVTFFVMGPVWKQVNDSALQPYLAGQIGEEQALEEAVEPVREFMLRQTREKDLALFLNFAGIKTPVRPETIPLHVLVPAFAISELKTAFQIGFFIFVPFIVIDLVVASTLMSMGMLMLPPMMISLPFKVLLFVMVDGWHLVVRSLVTGFG